MCLPLKGEGHLHPYMMQKLMSSPKIFIDGLQFWNIMHVFLLRKMVNSMEKADSYMMEDKAHWNLRGRDFSKWFWESNWWHLSSCFVISKVIFASHLLITLKERQKWRDNHKNNSANSLNVVVGIFLYLDLFYS